jgi:peptide/nickel transport system permease protein
MFFVTVLVFVIFRLIPGDPAQILLGQDPNPEVLAAMRRQMGLDRPIPQQFVVFLAGVLRGDLGPSIIHQEPVTRIVVERFGRTAELGLVALVLGTIPGVCAGLVAAMRRGSWTDLIVRVSAFLGYSTPRYFLAILLVYFFSVKLGLLPVTGYADPRVDLAANLRFLVLPAITMSLAVAAVQMRFLRSGMLDVIGQDYIRTARSKGLSERIVLVRHALKNALIPLVTFVGLQAGYLLGGSVIVEQLFAWPGIGYLTIQSIIKRDYPVVQGTVLMSAFVFIIINLLVDISYAYLDPRIRYGGAQ